MLVLREGGHPKSVVYTDIFLSVNKSKSLTRLSSINMTIKGLTDSAGALIGLLESGTAQDGETFYL